MRFRDLSPAARLYVVAVYATAAILLYLQSESVGGGGQLAPSIGGAASIWLFGLLTCGTALAHSFPVSSPDRQSYHVSPPLFVAGVILLEPLQLSFLMIVANIAERFRRRRSWFAQVFNVAAFVITATVAQQVYRTLGMATGDILPHGELVSVEAGIVSAFVFMGVNHGLVSIAIWLGNGIPPYAQRLLKWQTVATELLLLSMGIPLAYLAHREPWAVLLAAAPLLLVYRALELPDARAQRRRDGLTDLFTAEYLAEACDRELSRATASGRPLSLLVLNVNGLARINSAYGRQEGDSVLRGVAHRVLQTVRSFDIVGRSSPGEFGVVLPDCDADAALATARAICRAVEGTPHEIQGSIEPLAASVTVGIAVAPRGADASADLFTAARASLEHARQQDGNCIVRIVTHAGHPQDASAVADSIANAVPAAKSVSAALNPVPVRHDFPRRGSWSEGLQTPFTRALIQCVAGLWSRPLARAAAAAGPRWSMVALQIAVGLAAALTVATAAPDASRLDPLAVMLLWALVALADLRSFELFGGSTFAVSVVPHIAAGMLMGPAGAVVVAPFSALVRGIHRRSRWYKVVFNGNVYIIAAGSAAHVFRYVAPPLAADHLIGLLIPAAIAGSAYYLHTVVIAAAMSTESRTNTISIWREQFRWLWPHYMVLSGLALLFALAYSGHGIVGGAIFMVPTLMMHFVAKQYINRTLVNVRQLRALNEQLRAEIAQREAAEEEISRLAEVAARTAALEELNRLKNDFISVASHELRTPMTTIMGFSEILLDLPDRHDGEIISLIHEEAIHLSALVDNLLDVSRIENGPISIEPVPIDLSDTVLPPLLHALGMSASRHTLVSDVAENARWVYADRTKLNQILTNLIGNAIKYSPEGGTIRINVRRDVNAELLVISVSDPGIGIPRDELERVFERFYRIDRLETKGIGGTGLGLFISRHLTELHGGRLWAESEPGSGSTFYLVLPAAVPHEEWTQEGSSRPTITVAQAA